MRTQGCGHGECTTAETPCRYETPGCAPKLPERTSKETNYPRRWHGDLPLASSAVGVRLGESPIRQPQPDGVRWTAADLDRCEHGRHSIDHCFGCPGGKSHGNPFLLSAHSADGSIRLDGGGQSEIRVRQVDGRMEVRIGTMVRGEPIWAVVRDRPREFEVTEQEADGKLPCSGCGHRVRPGRHTQAECIKNQQDDRIENDEVAADEADRKETETDGE